MKEIALTKNQVALVDDDDYERVSSAQWHTTGHGRWLYARDGAGLLMHRIIMSPPPGAHIDHINHNGLDNRRANLRLCTREQNMGNRNKADNTSSRYKGVYWDSQRNKWRATIGKDNKHLGRYKSEEEAARAYNNAANQKYGQYALLNELALPAKSDTV